jgi:hypothetical protein
LKKKLRINLNHYMHKAGGEGTVAVVEGVKSKGKEAEKRAKGKIEIGD